MIIALWLRAASSGWRVITFAFVGYGLHAIARMVEVLREDVVELAVEAAGARHPRGAARLGLGGGGRLQVHGGSAGGGRAEPTATATPLAGRSRLQ